MAKKELSTVNRALEAQTKRINEMTTRAHLRVFAVSNPVTVYVRGTRCNIKIHYHELNQVEIHAKLYNAFGLLFAVEQDEAGVYIVVKRRRFLGLISRADFTLNVPHYAHLAFNLTPGTVRLDDINGIAEVMPRKQEIPTSLQQLPESQVQSLLKR